MRVHESSCYCPIDKEINQCPVAHCNIDLHKSEGYDSQWRKVGNQLMSRLIKRSIQPFVLGHDSNGTVKAIRGPIRKDWNGEWIFSEIVSGKYNTANINLYVCLSSHYSVK